MQVLDDEDEGALLGERLEESPPRRERLTAAISTDPSIASFEEVALRVVEEEGPESGRTKPAPDGAKIKVATSAEGKTFEQILLAVWNWRE